VDEREEMNMRVASVRELGGIGSVELSERRTPMPAAGQVLVRVRGAGVGPWDVAMVSGEFGRPALPRALPSSRLSRDIDTGTLRGAFAVRSRVEFSPR
jgi:hypothetical protein